MKRSESNGAELTKIGSSFGSACTINCNKQNGSTLSKLILVRVCLEKFSSKKEKSDKQLMKNEQWNWKKSGRGCAKNECVSASLCAAMKIPKKVENVPSSDAC